MKERPPLNLIDLHIHAYHGPDSQEKPENILAKAAQLGLVGVAITDHDLATAYVEVADHDYPLILAPGAEVTAATQERPVHILLITPYRQELIDFLVTSKPGQRPTPELTFSWALEHYPSVAVVAHPSPRGGRSGASFAQIETWVKHFGTSSLAIETANGGMIKFSFNADGTPTQKALKDWEKFKAATYFADKLNLPQLGNSDAHQVKFVGRSRTSLLEQPATVEDIIELIQRGACEPYLQNLDKMKKLAK